MFVSFINFTRIKTCFQTRHHATTAAAAADTSTKPNEKPRHMKFLIYRWVSAANGFSVRLCLYLSLLPESREARGQAPLAGVQSGPKSVRPDGVGRPYQDQKRDRSYAYVPSLVQRGLAAGCIKLLFQPNFKPNVFFHHFYSNQEYAALVQ